MEHLMTTYKIIGFDKTTGVISIQFDEKMAPLAIDVPLTDQGLYITGEELNQYIEGFIPTWHLDRFNKIASGIPNEAAIESLVEPPAPVEISEVATQQVVTDMNIEMWQQHEMESQIAKILVKFGVLQEDPTAINVTTL
jgi:hypothetical protein